MLLMAFCLVILDIPRRFMLNSFLINTGFRYIIGGITPVYYPTDTNWRQLPCWVIVVPKGGKTELETHIHGRMSCDAGCAAVIPPNLVHRFRTYPDTNFISQWSHVGFFLPGGMDVADFLDTPLLTSPKVGKRIAQINCDLWKLMQSGPANPLTITGRYLELGFGLLSAICTISKEKHNRTLLAPEAERIRGLLIFIEQQLHGRLDRDDLARRCNLSPARFHVVFQEVVGQPPMEFVKQQRMKKAQFLLSETQLPIKLIAGKVGYSDPYTFSRAFKNTVKVSPRHYRDRTQASFPNVSPQSA